MDKKIKPIPTFFDGVMFRSKLEARWAYFFNLCKIKWQYELEGYEFDDIKYLPDFYLPETKILIEIKPNLNFAKEEVTFNKLSNFSKSTKERFLIFVDTPIKAKYYTLKAVSDIVNNQPVLSEIKLAWILNNKNQYQPHYYLQSLEADDWMFEMATNHRF